MLLSLVRPGEIINVKIFFGRPVFVVDEDASKFLSAKAVAMRESDVINVVVIIAILPLYLYKNWFRAVSVNNGVFRTKERQASNEKLKAFSNRRKFNGDITNWDTCKLY